MISGYMLACLSGMTAALASVFAKLAVSDVTEVCDTIFKNHAICDLTQWNLRVFCIGLVITCNLIMWSMFVRALQRCSRSIEATVANTATNFFFTAFFGWSIFGEKLTLLWWFGGSFIVIGLLLMHRGISKDEQKQK